MCSIMARDFGFLLDIQSVDHRSARTRQELCVLGTNSRLQVSTSLCPCRKAAVQTLEVWPFLLLGVQ